MRKLSLAWKWTLLLWGVVQTGLTAQKPCVQPELTNDSKFAPGQVWSYKTRPNETESTITVLRIERTQKLGIIIHVRIDGIHFKDCKGEPVTNSLQHAPFAKEALERSVTTKVSEVTSLPDYSAGYKDWRIHCGGIYTISVSQMVALDDEQYKALLGCS